MTLNKTKPWIQSGEYLRSREKHTPSGCPAHVFPGPKRDVTMVQSQRDELWIRSNCIFSWNHCSFSCFIPFNMYLLDFLACENFFLSWTPVLSCSPRRCDRCAATHPRPWWLGLESHFWRTWANMPKVRGITA